VGKREGCSFYFAYFRGPNGERLEKTTGETAKHAAVDAAPPIILDVFKPQAANLSWDEALTLLREHMRAKNLRPTSIKQYEWCIGTLRRVYPKSKGPGDITRAMAQTYVVRRMRNPDKRLSPRTVQGNVGNLSIVFGHWLRDVLKVVDADPFAQVEPPKADKKPPRVISADEGKAFFAWLDKTWHWRLPLLFLETKAAIGCRIGELASAVTSGLQDGRIRFVSDTTKGRKERACLLPPALFAELKAIAGPAYVFERFAEELPKLHRKRGQLHHVRPFTPVRLVKWLQRQARTYFQKSKAARFKLHNFRGTAMSKARMARVAESDAAIAFGCNSGTMRQHYLALDEATIADDVFTRMAAAEHTS
jgi:integrase